MERNIKGKDILNAISETIGKNSKRRDNVSISDSFGTFMEFNLPSLDIINEDEICFKDQNKKYVIFKDQNKIYKTFRDELKYSLELFKEFDEYVVKIRDTSSPFNIPCIESYSIKIIPLHKYHNVTLGFEKE